MPDVTFEEACLRWLEEKADKKSIDSDKSRIAFWIEHFEGIRIKDISEAMIYSVISKAYNRKTKERWKLQVEAALRKGKEPPA
ncbi:hypothetical protein ACDU05_004877 [Escherichia coli]|nr:integrase [Escherichia coli]EFF2574905.1 integrase [Escherichia coli]EFH7403534.1 integrase [Escherichia coli]EFK1983029.1 integrase [Escherichia coli]EGE2237318.1 integrase [Escherichia coli]